jgi:hypothetical protein
MKSLILEKFGELGPLSALPTNAFIARETKCKLMDVVKEYDFSGSPHACDVSVLQGELGESI